MPVFRKLSLGQLLTVPYVVLVLALSTVLGVLSYRAGRSAVDNLSDRLLTETVGRIAQAVERQVSVSSSVLETAFPHGVAAPSKVAAALPELRTRFWLATSIHRELNNYAYYGDLQGHFVGLWRHGEEEAELRLRTRSEGPRLIQRFVGIAGQLQTGQLEQSVFEPRERPWFKAALQRQAEVWSPIYIDFRTHELVATRARPVLDAQQHLRGVVATDVSLKQLSDFVRSLPISQNGFAFIEEPSGDLIASSRGTFLTRGPGDKPQRLNAQRSEDALLARVHQEVRAWTTGRESDLGVRAGKILDEQGKTVQVAYSRIRDAAGLDWIIVVAVPRGDFLKDVIDNTWQTLALGLVAALSVVAVGALSLQVVSRDLRKLAVAAKDLGEGQFDTPIRIRRSDEIGDLAQSFATMRHKLATDRLTGLASREAMARRLEDRISRHRRGADGQPFGLLFLDVDGFKSVNDRYGHEAGDAVLHALGQRLQALLREDDLVARWAGDEFLILLHDVAQVEQAGPVIEKIHAALRVPLGGIPVAASQAVGVSIGLAIYPQDGNDVASLVAHADADMYRHKGGTAGGD